MRVSLGTIEVDDDARKAIRKDMGQSGHATRNDVKDYLLEKIDGLLASAGAGPAPAQEQEAGVEDEDDAVYYEDEDEDDIA